MKMPMSEVLDRYSITRIRAERTDKDVIAELKFYEDIMKDYDPKKIQDFFNKLYKVNLDLWIVEEIISKELSTTNVNFERIGHMAMQVRDLNWERNKVKGRVSEAFDTVTLNYSKVKYGRA